MYFHFAVSTPGWEMPELPVPSKPPFSKPRSHVNQLSAAINPFPPQKLDLFIRLPITFHPPESLLCLVHKRRARSDPLHLSEHSGGMFRREASSSWHKVSSFSASPGRKRGREADMRRRKGSRGREAEEDSPGRDLSIVDVHKLYFVKLGLKLLLRLKRHTRRSKDALRLCLFPHKAEERRWHKERVIFWGCRTSSINKTLPTTVTPTRGQKLTLYAYTSQKWTLF